MRGRDPIHRRQYASLVVADLSHMDGSRISMSDRRKSEIGYRQIVPEAVERGRFCRPMTGMPWAALRELLVNRYEDFRVRLTRQFGSEELASETLHETWLRLHRQGEAGSVHSPAAFLMRIAANIAKDRQRAERRRARRSEIDAALEIADPAPGPAQEAQARLDLKMAERAIMELPVRTRAILIASRLEGVSHQAIADRLGISRRTVLYELNRAVAHLDAQLDNNVSSDCTHEPRESS